MSRRLKDTTVKFPEGATFEDAVRAFLKTPPPPPGHPSTRKRKTKHVSKKATAEERPQDPEWRRKRAAELSKEMAAILSGQKKAKKKR